MKVVVSGLKNNRENSMYQESRRKKCWPCDPLWDTKNCKIKPKNKLFVYFNLYNLYTKQYEGFFLSINTVPTWIFFDLVGPSSLNVTRSSCVFLSHNQYWQWHIYFYLPIKTLFQPQLFSTYSIFGSIHSGTLKSSMI